MASRGIGVEPFHSTSPCHLCTSYTPGRLRLSLKEGRRDTLCFDFRRTRPILFDLLLLSRMAKPSCPVCVQIGVVRQPKYVCYECGKGYCFNHIHWPWWFAAPHGIIPPNMPMPAVYVCMLCPQHLPEAQPIINPEIIDPNPENH